MASKKSTNISLTILGVACVLAIAYFVWTYLAPSVPATTPVASVSAANIDTGVVTSNGFKALQKYVNLPIKAGLVGRDDPFSDFAPPPAENANANVNAPAENSPAKIQ
jgi:hypothetical protein